MKRDLVYTANLSVERALKPLIEANTANFLIDNFPEISPHRNHKTQMLEGRMSREDLISKIAGEAKISKKDAGAALSAFINAVTLAMEAGEKVSLVGFGTFSVVKRNARKGINPRTQKEIKIPARSVPVFRAGKKLKAACK